MMRRTPLQRSGWARKPKPPRELEEQEAPALSPAVAPVAKPLRRAKYAAPANDPVIPRPKEAPIQHEGYMRLVRQLPCAHCGVEGFTQFCHADEGKGAGIKSDCRLGWPGCGPRPGVRGCHYLIGTERIYPKEKRRALEACYGAQTREHLQSRSLWPLDLPYTAKFSRIFM
jgi:hypothetical protein